MSMKPNALLPTILLFFTVLLLTGCTPKGEKLAEELHAAWNNQQAITTHHMSGKAELQLDLPLADAEQQPLTSALLYSLLHSQYAWQGSSDADAARFETTMTITPAALGAAIHIPILIEENTLYFHLPMINKADEYMEIPMGDQFGATAAQMQGVFAEWLAGITSSVDVSWLTEAEAGHPEHRLIHMAISDERLPLVLNAAADQWDRMLSRLTEAELDASLLRDVALGDYLRSASFSKDGHLNVTLDANGHIYAIELFLPFLVDGPSGEAAEQLISFHYTWDRINEEIERLQSKPALTKSLDAIYPLIK
ncbi:hypothetical protein DUZ99_05200 [Xylanibacillus composti]|uniref:Uncharacterized protein n=1 Tax=Xylanibacillus composti TaxID=1572762 RepID=A0A8J4GZ90_9BACL|nr:hypothetical protein [Xylanibacillus composti]MDT9724384.1 hypothetical protein [Xylanibacillus composti]GIQ67978.1 hypothetical protein XYCOK13_08020 [Xylanibacillus composti]